MRSLLKFASVLMVLAASPALAQEADPVATAPVESAPDGALQAPPPSTSGVPLTANDLNTWLDGYMPYALSQGDIAGAVVVVVKDGEILTERGFGYSDVAEREPVDPKTTLFRPGSVSKLITWTAVMQQVEQGKIDLDADINTYLDFKIPARDGKPVTMRNLMQHTAGFEEQVKGLLANSVENTLPYDVLLKQYTPERIYPVGTTPAYSNYGASLAGYIVERVSGEPFDDYLDHHIFEPLGMRYSTFRQPLPATLQPYMSKGYSKASSEPSDFEFVGPAPAGSMSSPGVDMAKFMIAHLQNGEYQGHRILKPETAELMHNSPLTVLPPLNRMELGFFETNINGREVIAHLGDTEVFHTSLHLFLKEGVGFYVSFNSAGREGASGGLRGAMFTDFADRYFPGEEPVVEVDSQTAAQHAAMLVGRWNNSRRVKSNFLDAVYVFGQTAVKVGPKGELLTPDIKGLNGEPRDWVEISPFVWRDRNSHEMLAAKVVDGKAVRFSVDGFSPFMVFDRVPASTDSAWLTPMFGVTLGALGLTVLLWPITALVRWRYRASFPLEGSAARWSWRLTRVAALAMVAAMLVWAVTITQMFGDFDRLSASFDPVLRAVQIFGAVALIGGALFLLWNVKTVWTGKRSWFAKLWSLVLALSGLFLVWAGFALKLIAYGVNY
ncbi:MAG: serine hydrolase domain-containing protein [Pseudomonadota bacterium]